MMIKQTLAAALTAIALLTVICTQGNAVDELSDSSVGLPNGWKAMSPRDELRPTFSWNATGGVDGKGSFVIIHDNRDGLDGWVQKSFDVHGGEHIRFQAQRKTQGVPDPRRSCLVRIRWTDKDNHMVTAAVPEEQIRATGNTPSAEPEHPVDGATDRHGWTTVSGIYPVPKLAEKAIVELHMQWAPGGSVEWSQVSLEACDAPASRKVRLATIHYQPKGKSLRENCEEFAPLLEEAAKKKANLVVLGETIPSAGVAISLAESAETIPGPSTDYFCELALKNKLHVVFSLYEREKHLIYNTAVLIDPKGKIVGRYRKVCLPHGEAEKGVAPGHEYPVFETSIGRIGMMICYDGFFPEVARELSNRGAEVIAWPVWGCNPLLAKARACENHVFLVSSTFMAPKDGWMISAVFDQTGFPIAAAENWGEVTVAEVDLSKPYIGPYNLGDFHSMIPRHRPELPK